MSMRTGAISINGTTIGEAFSRLKQLKFEVGLRRLSLE
jgi:hypothetical protein